MRVIPSFVVLFLYALLSACTTGSDVLSPEEKEAISGSSLMIVQRPPASFDLYKTSDAWLEALAYTLGPVAILAAGGLAIATDSVRDDKFSKEFELVDPKQKLTAELGRYLGPRYGMCFVGLTKTVFDTSNNEEIANALKGSADFALSVKTHRWRIYGLFGGSYRYTYAASMHLLDISAGEVIASGQCQYETPKGSTLRFKEFTNDNAGALKLEFHNGAKACAAQFAVDILKATEIEK